MKSESGSVFSQLRAAMRPHQWTKNLLVLLPLLPEKRLTDPGAVVDGLLAFAAFCLISSAVYLWNDVADCHRDRQHPLKRLRPVASGALSSTTAIVAAVALAAVGFLLAVVVGVASGQTFPLIILLYLAQNLVYSRWLKRTEILGVMALAFGFVLRVVAGAVAIGTEVSPWQLLCILSLALLVAFGKRRLDLYHRLMARDQPSGEPVYSKRYLEMAMSMCGAAGIVTYSLYCVSQPVFRAYGSYGMVFTIPMVLYGVFRFVYLVEREHHEHDPSRLFVTDRYLLIAGCLWLATYSFFLYAPRDIIPWWRFEV